MNWQDYDEEVRFKQLSEGLQAVLHLTTLLHLLDIYANRQYYGANHWIAFVRRQNKHVSRLPTK